MSPRRQPRERLSAVVRTEQIVNELRARGPLTLAQIAPTMGCSETLVLFYAKRCAHITVAKERVQTRLGPRTRTMLSLVPAQLVDDRLSGAA